MRRRLTLAMTPFAIVLALMLPASTLAANGGFAPSIYKDYCTDLPSNVFKVVFSTDGTSSANKLTIDSKGQTGHPGNWTTFTNWSQKSKTFAAHTADQVTLQRTYDGDAFARNRIVFWAKAWHNSTLLYSRKLVSVSC